MTTVNGQRRAIAVADLALDKKVEPLGVDTKLRVRPRSALGLKYVELQPGTSKKTFTSGDTVPVKNASEPLEFEDLFSTFDPKTRPHIQNATAGFGDAFAGRGQSINRSIEALNPFFRALTPVMTNLADPKTELDQFFLQIGRASAQVAPVARTQALLFTDMADTFAAISADPRALQDTIEKAAAHDGRLDPVLPRPAAVLRGLHRPLAPAAPRRRRAAALAAADQQRLQGRHADPAQDGRAEREPRGRVQRGERPVREPEHAARAARHRHGADREPPGDPVHRALPDGLQLPELLHPPAGRGAVRRPVGPDRRRHLAEPEHEGAELEPAEQLRHARPARGRGTSRSGTKPQSAKDAQGNDLFRLYAPPYQPAIDAQGNADCQLGQAGYPNGRLNNGRYEIGNLQDASDDHGLPIPSKVGKGGNGAIVPDDNNLPGLAGGTYVTRKLGIKNLRDVP